MKRFWMTMLLVVVLCVSLTITAYAASESESNNSKGTADTIKVNTDVTGVTKKGDTDWYKFKLSKAGYVTISFNHPLVESDQVYWQLRLYTSDGKTSAYGADVYWTVSGNANQETAQIGLGAGTYYVVVSPESEESYCTDQYTLQIQYEASETWESEVNGSPDQADPITLGTPYCGATMPNDEDWFCFTLPEDGYVSLAFEHEIPPVTDELWRLDLWLEDGKTNVFQEGAVWSVYGTESLETTRIGLPAGTYYLRVRPGSVDVTDVTTYTLQVDYEAAANWETESNNVYYTADILELNTHCEGSVFLGDEDWFMVALPQDGVLTLELSHPSIGTYTDGMTVAVYEAQEVSNGRGAMYYWSIPAYEDRSLPHVGLPAGIYYIQILPGNMGYISQMDYTLTARFEQAESWETESNDYDDQADPIRLNQDVFGTTIREDADWYVFELRTDSELIVRFIHDNCGNSNLFWLVDVFAGDGVTRMVDTLAIGADTQDPCLNVGALPAGIYYVRVCAGSYYHDCDGVYTLRLEEIHDHVYTHWEVQQAPTCTRSGSQTSACDACGYVCTEILEAIGHNVLSWNVLSEATCENVGNRRGSCTVCQSEILEDLLKLPHNYAEPVHLEGSVVFGPRVYEQICQDCGHREVYEDNTFWWVLPLLISLVIEAAVAAVVLCIHIRRKRVLKATFTCPYCFETHMALQLRLRCSNMLCQDMPDPELTQYERGNLSCPKMGKPVFPFHTGHEPPKKLPKTAPCPYCRQEAHKLVCPSCHNTLPETILKGKNMMLSIVGSRDAGKSHFLGVIVKELVSRIAPAFDGSLEGLEDSMDRYEQHFGRNLYVDLRKLDLTPSSLNNIDNGAYRPLIFTLRLRKKIGPWERVRNHTLVFFDAAGEDLTDADTMETVNKYIGKSDGMIFLLDPTKIPDVATQLDAEVLECASSVSWQRSSNPDDILARVSKMIRQNQGLKDNAKINTPMAVVFAKFDTVASLIPEGSTVLRNSPHCREKALVLSDCQNVNDEVEALLRNWGAGSFLAQLEINYKHHACFAASALGLNNNPGRDMRIQRPRPHRIEDALLWLLWKKKMIQAKK